MKLWRPKRNRQAEKLSKELADCRQQLDTTARLLAVVEAERDSLAAVVARDRARVMAEAAQYATVRADNEQRTNAGIR